MKSSRISEILTWNVILNDEKHPTDPKRFTVQTQCEQKRTHISLFAVSFELQILCGLKDSIFWKASGMNSIPQNSIFCPLKLNRVLSLYIETLKYLLRSLPNNLSKEESVILSLFLNIVSRSSRRLHILSGQNIWHRTSAEVSMRHSLDFLVHF